jgi:hypothetical protein
MIPLGFFMVLFGVGISGMIVGLVKVAEMNDRREQRRRDANIFPH